MYIYQVHAMLFALPQSDRKDKIIVLKLKIVPLKFVTVLAGLVTCVINDANY